MSEKTKTTTWKKLKCSTLYITRNHLILCYYGDVNQHKFEKSGVLSRMKIHGFEEKLRPILSKHIKLAIKSNANIVLRRLPSLLTWEVEKGELWMSVSTGSTKKGNRIRERTWEICWYHCNVPLKASLIRCCQTNPGEHFPRALVWALLH